MTRSPRSLALVLLALSAPALADCPPLGQGQPQSGQLGVVVDNGLTFSFATQLTGPHTMKRIGILCFGVDAIYADVIVSPPDPGAPYRGTVVLGTGGSGTFFYEEGQGGEVVAQTLQSLGFRVVQRRWTLPEGQGGGWLDVGGTATQRSCLYATLLRWISDTQHTGGKLVVSGNSGGSAEIGYALTRWEMEDCVDAAVLSSGPPASRLDINCGLVAPPNCPDAGLTTTSSCGPGGPACTNLQVMQAFDLCSAPDLEADSILWDEDDADTHYPNTRVFFLFGTLDCQSSAVPQGRLYHDAITSAKALQYVRDGLHWLPATPGGQDAIIDAVLAGAACYAPALLSPVAWPSAGGVVTLRVWGDPYEHAHIHWSLESSVRVDMGTPGWEFLDAGYTPLATITLDEHGFGAYDLSVPSELLGSLVNLQARLGPYASPRCYTNLNAFVAQ